MNRREFLTGATAFSIAAAGRANGLGAASNRVRLAIIGCARSEDHGAGFVFDPKGSRGRGFMVMCRAAETLGAEISTVCDIDRTCLAYAASEVKNFGGNTPKTTTDWREVMTDDSIDGVIVATPDHSHAYLGCEAMKAKKALFLEKPIGVTAGEAEVLRAVQQRTGQVFTLGTQRRSSYATQQAIAFIRSGKIGQPHWAKAWCMSDRPAIRGVEEAEIPAWMGSDGWDNWQLCAPRAKYRTRIAHYNWRFFKGYGTGDLPNNGLHFVDIARWALGADYPTRVYAGGGKYFCEGEDWTWDDTQTLTVQFPDRKYITWEGCSHSGAHPFMGKWTGCLVYCDDGLAFFGPLGEAAIYDRKGKVVLKEWAAADTDPSKQEGATRLSDPIRGCDLAHMRNFVDCVRDRNLETAQPIDSAIKSNLLTELGNVSLQTGEAIHVDPQTGRPVSPDSPAWKFWNRTYEPGFEVKG